MIVENIRIHAMIGCGINMGYQDRVNIEDFIGKTFTEIRGMESGSDSIFFVTDECQYMMYHGQDCCESVSVDDIVGDVNDLLNCKILEAYEADSGDAKPLGKYDDSYTWTFYRLATIKGTVTIKWYGTSNGYYSESVDIEKIKS